MYPLANPSLTIKLRGYIYHGHVFLMWLHNHWLEHIPLQLSPFMSDSLINLIQNGPTLVCPTCFSKFNFYLFHFAIEFETPPIFECSYCFLGYNNATGTTVPLGKLAHAIYKEFFSAVKIENFNGKFFDDLLIFGYC